MDPDVTFGSMMMMGRCSSKVVVVVVTVVVVGGGSSTDGDSAAPIKWCSYGCCGYGSTWNHEAQFHYQLLL
jgi:hypothetical protein